MSIRGDFNSLGVVLLSPLYTQLIVSAHFHPASSLLSHFSPLSLLSSLTSLLSLTFPLSHYKIRVTPSPLFSSTLDSPPPFFCVVPTTFTNSRGDQHFMFLLRVSMIPSLSLFSLDREKGGLTAERYLLSLIILIVKG